MFKFAIFGNPITHSLSPSIHQFFAKQLDLMIDYQKIETPIGKLREKLNRFRQQGGHGANITLPFKEEAAKYADELTERARLSQSVNTLIFEPDGKCIGDNTDGIGFLRDITHRLHWKLRDKNILLIGAGGAARGILPAIISEKPKHIFVWNRSASKIEKMAKDFEAVVPVSNIKNHEFNIIINATNANFQHDIDLSCELKNTNCFDLNYGERHQTFLKWCQLHHSNTISDGLGMLIEQAAESFFQWTGRKPYASNALMKFSIST